MVRNEGLGIGDGGSGVPGVVFEGELNFVPIDPAGLVRGVHPGLVGLLGGHDVSSERSGTGAHDTDRDRRPRRSAG